MALYRGGFRLTATVVAIGLTWPLCTMAQTRLDAASLFESPGLGARLSFSGTAESIGIRGFPERLGISGMGNAPVPPSLKSRILTAVGTALIGAGLGFFASHVVRGDWDDGSGSRSINRPTWAAVGGSLGLAFGFTHPIGTLGPPAGRLIPQPYGRLRITAQEVRDLGARDAFETVALLRPEWFFPELSGVQGEGGGGTVSVYLNDVRLGGPDLLRCLGTNHIESIRLLSPSVARRRWGPGNQFGAIQVTFGAGNLPIRLPLEASRLREKRAPDNGSRGDVVLPVPFRDHQQGGSSIGH
jgi:hypothetical protein